MHRTLLIATSALALALPAHAQDTAEPIVTAGDGSADIAVPEAPATTTAGGDDADAVINTYAPAYFEQFQPLTALDMVRQVPGFSLRGGSGGARGFGEANANFLINGRRPSTKGQDAGDLLGRIAARSVIRIEVLDGASLDIPGLSGQVVNVVARAVDLSGNWQYAARFEEGTAPQMLEGQINLSGEAGNLGFAVGFDSGQFTFSEDSREFFATDRPDRGGRIYEERIENIGFDNRRPTLTANLSWTPDNGHVANLNSRLRRRNNYSDVREQFEAVGPEGVDGVSDSSGSEDEWEVEVSGDYALLAGPGQFKAIALYRFEDSDFDTRFVSAPVGVDPVRTIFARREKETEAIARAEYAFKPAPAHDVQVSAEYAYNLLDATSSFENNFVLPVLDAVRVDEDRFDVRATDSWTVSDALSLQGSVGFENSTISVDGPGQEPRSFFRPKGFVAASYVPTGVHAFRARVERGVGQLNFNDFVSRRSLADSLITGGNDDIVPEQFWNLSVEYERTDPSLLSGRISPFYRRIEDPIDQVLFTDGTSGPGNLDSAERYGIEGEVTLVMDSLGAPGLRLEASGLLQDTNIDDPLTGERRGISRQTKWAYDLEARYDIPGTDIALTAEAENDQTFPFVRFDEIQNIIVDDPFVEVGVIFKDVYGLQLSIVAQNLLDNTIIRERERYLGEDQRLGPITRYEEFGRIRGRRISFVLEGTF